MEESKNDGAPPVAMASVATPPRHTLLLVLCLTALCAELLIFTTFIGRVVASARLLVALVTLSGPVRVLLCRFGDHHIALLPTHWQRWRSAIVRSAPWILVPFVLLVTMLVIVVQALQHLQ